MDETETLEQLESAKLTPQDWMNRIQNMKPTGQKVDAEKLTNL